MTKSLFIFIRWTVVLDAVTQSNSSIIKILVFQHLQWYIGFKYASFVVDIYTPEFTSQQFSEKRLSQISIVSFKYKLQEGARIFFRKRDYQIIFGDENSSDSFFSQRQL